VVVSEGLFILASCLLRPMSRTSVLEEFSVRRLAVIEEEIRSRACIASLHQFYAPTTDKLAAISSSRPGIGRSCSDLVQLKMYL